VIVFKRPKAPNWRYFVVRLPSGRIPVDDWILSETPEELRFSVHDGLKDAQKVENPTNWLCFKRYMRGKLGKHKIFELWFDCGDNREYRLLGIVGKERQHAIFLLGYHHKGNTYDPPGALDTACDYARWLEEGKLEIYERKIPIYR
jgi:hypothetical protein